MNNEKLALIIRKPRMDLTISYALELNKKTNLILEILTNVQDQLTTKTNPCAQITRTRN